MPVCGSPCVKILSPGDSISVRPAVRTRAASAGDGRSRKLAPSSKPSTDSLKNSELAIKGAGARGEQVASGTSGMGVAFRNSRARHQAKSPRQVRHERDLDRRTNVDDAGPRHSKDIAG